MASFRQVDFFRWVNQTVQFWRHHGFVGGWANLRQMNEIVMGELKGTDINGNQYFENLDYMSGRTRWVVYADKENDPTTVEPLWHGWLHYTTDKTPLEKTPYIPRFYRPREPNKLSVFGSQANYLPPGHYNREKPSVPLIYSTWKEVETNPRAMKTQHFGPYDGVAGSTPTDTQSNTNFTAAVAAAAKDSGIIDGSKYANSPLITENHSTSTAQKKSS